MAEPGDETPDTTETTQDESTSPAPSSVVGSPDPVPTPPDRDDKDKGPRSDK
ncbi:hypothetical protein [Paludisphaera soli]|uniref:hypothetical protein n=1 Tax=Paludisphaera soli TaxID=2712865 RepID=UPI0013EAB40E|nr:hypothetical protein [Paludisphaera soli]